MAGLLPSYINIRRGAYIGLIISCAMCPWELLASASVFISVLSAYSVFLGPMVGIYVCEYWVLRQRRIKLSDLYHPRPDGIYHYWHGINWRSFVSWVVGWAYLIPGFVSTSSRSTKPRGIADVVFTRTGPYRHPQASQSHELARTSTTSLSRWASQSASSST